MKFIARILCFGVDLGVCYLLSKWINVDFVYLIALAALLNSNGNFVEIEIEKRG